MAAELGMDLSNYNRLENGKTKLRTDKMAQIAEILHCDPADLIGPPSSVRTVSVRQHIEAGAWSESITWDEDDWYDVAVPDDEEFRGYSLHGAETRGPSMNRRYPERSVLVYTSIIETREDVQVGKRYIIERERPDGLREATVKTLVRDEVGELWLMPESTDPRFQQPIRLADGDGDIVRVVGKVVYSVLRED